MAWWNPIDWISGVNAAEARGREIDRQVAAYDAQSTNARYAPGGDIYNRLAQEYGPAGADRVYAAVINGQDISDTIAALRYGDPLQESTTTIFTTQLVTDPLGAPLDAADNYIGTNVTNALKGLFRSPWVTAAIVLVLAIYFWPVLRPFVGRLTKQLR
jgi:hypothetical protein